MDTPEPPEKAIEGQGVYRELIELMEAFILEMEIYEAKASSFDAPETK